MADQQTEQASLEAQFDDLMVDFSKTSSTTTTTTSTNVETEDGVTVTTTTTTTNSEMTNGVEHSSSEQSASEQSLSDREGLTIPQPGSVTHRKQQYTEGKQKFQPIVIRKTKKLDHQWGKQETKDPQTKPPQLQSSSSQKMVSLSNLGCDYTKDSPSKPGSAAPPRSPVNPDAPIVNRITVEKCQAPEITKNVRAMFETGDLPDIHGIKKTKITVYEEKGAGVFENSPSQRDDVIRETDKPMEQFKEGFTRQLTESWLNKENEGPELQDRGPIQLAEDEGCILENEPVKRDDVLRESDMKEDDTVLIEQGKTSDLTNKFLNYKDEFKKDDGPIKLYDENDATPVVLENEPAPQRPDVVTSDVNAERVFVQRGKASNLKSFFSSQPEYQKENRPLDIATDGGIVLESQPTFRDDVVRESDVAEVDKSVRLEAGRSRNLATMWQNRRDEYQSKGFVMDVDSGEPTVIENEPTMRDDVIREGMKTEEELRTEAGHTMKLAGRFLGNADEDYRQGPKEMIQLDRGGVQVVENEPEERTDVIKCSVDYEAREHNVQSGTARGLVEQWINTNDEVVLEQRMDRHSKPKWLEEIEKARAEKAMEPPSDDEPDQGRLAEEDEMINDHEVLIPEMHTSSMRNRWQQIQEEEEARLRKERCPEPVRFTPPREVTPPPLKSGSGYQSVQSVTFSSNMMNGPQEPAQNSYSPPVKRQNVSQQQQQNGETLTSKTVISLKSS